MNYNSTKLRLSDLTQYRELIYTPSFSVWALVSCLEPLRWRPLSQGDCPVGWIDGSVVGMGCLHFNHTEDMTMLEAAVSCQQGMDNATLVEILTSAVSLLVID